MLQRVSRSFQFVAVNRGSFWDVIWWAMSCVFEVAKRTWKSQDLLLTQVAITSHQNIDLNWDYRTVAGERLLNS